MEQMPVDKINILREELNKRWCTLTAKMQMTSGLITSFIKQEFTFFKS